MAGLTLPASRNPAENTMTFWSALGLGAGLTLRTSRREGVREGVRALAAEDIGSPEETGVATLLGRLGGAVGGEAGSPAFLARSLRAAANVDLELAVAG